MKPYVINKGVQLILTVPYRGGEGGQKSEKLPYVIHERPLSDTLYPVIPWKLTNR